MKSALSVDNGFIAKSVHLGSLNVAIALRYTLHNRIQLLNERKTVLYLFAFQLTLMIIVNCVTRPASEPTPADRMRVVTPVSLSRPAEGTPVGAEPFHRSHADILLSPTPPPRAPSGPQLVASSPVPIEAAVRVPQQHAAPPPVPATIDSRVKPVPKPFTPTPRQSEVLKYIQDEERSVGLVWKGSQSGSKF